MHRNGFHIIMMVFGNIYICHSLGTFVLLSRSFFRKVFTFLICLIICELSSSLLSLSSPSSSPSENTMAKLLLPLGELGTDWSAEGSTWAANSLLLHSGEHILGGLLHGVLEGNSVFVGEGKMFAIPVKVLLAGIDDGAVLTTDALFVVVELVILSAVETGSEKLQGSL